MVRNIQSSAATSERCTRDGHRFSLRNRYPFVAQSQDGLTTNPEVEEWNKVKDGCLDNSIFELDATVQPKARAGGMKQGVGGRLCMR